MYLYLYIVFSPANLLLQADYAGFYLETSSTHPNTRDKLLKTTKGTNASRLYFYPFAYGDDYSLRFSIHDKRRNYRAFLSIYMSGRFCRFSFVMLSPSHLLGPALTSYCLEILGISTLLYSLNTNLYGIA